MDIQGDITEQKKIKDKLSELEKNYININDLKGLIDKWEFERIESLEAENKKLKHKQQNLTQGLIKDNNDIRTRFRDRIKVLEEDQENIESVLIDFLDSLWGLAINKLPISKNTFINDLVSFTERLKKGAGGNRSNVLDGIVPKGKGVGSIPQSTTDAPGYQKDIKNFGVAYGIEDAPAEDIFTGEGKKNPMGVIAYNNHDAKLKFMEVRKKWIEKEPEEQEWRQINFVIPECEFYNEDASCKRANIDSNHCYSCNEIWCEKKIQLKEKEADDGSK